MKMTCALCGRPTEPAILIGNEAIGLTCAKNTGLMGVKPTKSNRLRQAPKRSASARGRRAVTLDLFPEAA